MCKKHSRKNYRRCHTNIFGREFETLKVLSRKTVVEHNAHVMYQYHAWITLPTHMGKHSRELCTGRFTRHAQEMMVLFIVHVTHVTLGESLT